MAGPQISKQTVDPCERVQEIDRRAFCGLPISSNLEEMVEIAPQEQYSARIAEPSVGVPVPQVNVSQILKESVEVRG